MTVTRSPGLEAIYAPIEADLKDFSSLLHSELASSDDLISQMNQHILKMTGKFMRPALTILTARAGSGRALKPEVIRLSAAIELIHTATLVHDDIIDNSDYRRNQPSVHSKWGRDLSIVSGDYLYARAFILLASLKDSRIMEAFALCAQVMCEGEMKQIEKRRDFLMAEDQYLKIIHQKTAALFQAACMGGSFFGGLGLEAVQRVGEYGFNLGMAFQIVDDCLDLVGDTQSLGKTTGLDIVKNDVTLPVLYIFASIGDAERKALLAELSQGSSELLSKIKTLSLQTGAVDRAMEKARGYADKAIEGLKDFKPSPFKASLAGLVRHCVDRIR